MLANPAAPPIGIEHALEMDRFLPFRVAIVEVFTPEGAAQPLPRMLHHGSLTPPIAAEIASLLLPREPCLPKGDGCR